MMNALDSTSTRPYLLRALYEWCTDNALTPYIAVLVDDTVQVPREYVQNGEIVLNVSTDATSGLRIGNEFIEFKARFGGVPREIIVPIDRVIAIYARENGQGMAFPMPEGPTDLEPQAPAETLEPPAPSAGLRLAPAPATTAEPPADPDTGGDEPPPAAPPAGARPSLKRIK